MKTLLNATNDVLTNLGWVNSGETLTTLTDAGKQDVIDQCVQAWNMTIQELYRQAGKAMPTGAGTGNITLATSTREYALPTGFLEIQWPLVDETNGYTIEEYPGGYDAMRQNQLQPSNWTGRPYYAAINPATNKLRMDTEPTANENGDVYVMFFKKSLLMSDAADTVPFNDDVYTAMIQPVSEYLRAIRNADPDFSLSQLSFSRAASYLDGNLYRTKW